LLHADPHIGNTYVLPDQSVGFLDWQCCRRGSWAMDLAYFLVSALTVDDRRAAEERLLEVYLHALTVPRDELPTVDEVRRRYDAAHPYGLVVWMVTHQSDNSQRAAVCRALIERFGAAFADGDSERALELLGA
jgi:aminoglycoside phosphotransferase (APT) family kinase protein